MKKLKKIIKAHKLICFILIIAIIKQIVVSKIPIFAFATAGCDDRLMVRLADFLLKGDWLGPYDEMTFVKGMFFPLFLAVSNRIGISYINASMLFYTFACVVFIYAIRPILKKEWPMYLIYVVLMFNPVSFANATLQRVYRNGITMGQVLLVIGCMMAVYLRNKEKFKYLISWSVMGGLSLAALWNTREDGVWILPFVVVAIIVTIINIRNLYGTFRSKKCFKHIIISILPVVILVGSNSLISAINMHYYREFVTNELNQSSFPDAMKSLYAVVPDEEGNELEDRVSISVSTLEKVYEVSPTMKKLKPNFEKILPRWDQCDSHPGDGQLENGWFFWCFRNVVRDDGYYQNSQKANETYKKIHTEIENAFKKGLLKKRITMPSALMAPWKSGNGMKIIGTMRQVGEFVVKYDSVETNLHESITDNGNGIKWFESITNNHAIYPLEKGLKMSGWIVSMNDLVNIRGQIIDSNGEKLKELNLKGGEDVYNNFLQTRNLKLVNAKNSRFSINIDNYTFQSGLKLKINDDKGNVIDTIELDGNTKNLQDDKVAFYADELISIDETKGNEIRNYAKPYVDICNNVGKIYKDTGIFTAILGAICYIFITMILVVKMRNREEYNLVGNAWLLLTAILCSFIVLLAGVSYTHVTAFPAINYMYLSGAYPLIILFWTIALSVSIEQLMEKLKAKQK